MITFRITLTFILSTASLLAASPADDAWDAYLKGDFKAVEQIYRQASQDTSLADSLMSQVYIALGCSQAMQNQDVSATISFQQAFFLFPDLRYSATDFPPPVWKLFEPLQERQIEQQALAESDFRKRENTTDESRIDTVYKEKQIQHSQTQVFSSLLLPGIAQVRDGNKHGWIYFGATFSLLGGTIWSLYQTESARSDYMHETSAAKFDSAYDTYNQYHKLSMVLASATAISYLIAQYDYFAKPAIIYPEILATNSILLNVRITLDL